jgi:Flp pilus assembly protein CpaB
MRWRRVAGSPAVFWVAAAGLAVLTGSMVSHLVGAAAAEAARYGSPRPAVVATRRVPVGATVRAGDVAVRRLPAALVPAGGLRRPPVGRTVVAPLFPGQVVVAGQLAPDGLTGVAALLPRGRQAVAVPTGSARPPVRLGDRVDVLATFDPDKAPDDAPEGEPTFPVATGAMVVDVGPDAVTVAVEPDEAARVAFAITAGTVTLAVRRSG